ncbi:hypothetical protein [Ekhidna sp.]
MKKVTYDILMGILPVMIGVYLGIYFNNQNENAKQQELSDKILESLYQENKNNIMKLEASLDYFIQLRDSSDHLLRLKKPYKQFQFWKGLNPPDLSSTAFNVAQVTNTLPGFSIGLVQHLSSTYSSIEDLQSQAHTYFSSVTNQIGSPNFEDRYLAVLFNYAYDMVSSEEQLLEIALELDKQIKEIN